VTLVAELTRALNELDRQPHGAARIATAERLVDEAAETGDRPVLIAALQEQITAYNFGGESQRMLVPFARVLKMWDDRPEDFNDYARYRLFWHFKWASTGMIWHPDVPLATVQHWLDEMERRYSPEKPWTRAKMEPGKFDAMTKAIVGFEVDPMAIRGTRKFNQHKSADDLAATVSGQQEVGREDIVAAIKELARNG